MADAAYFVHDAKMARRTRSQIRDKVARTVYGKPASDLTAIESTECNDLINAVQGEWRRKFPGFKGYCERTWSLTWDVANTRMELALDFAELGDGGRITLLDVDGEDENQLEVIRREPYEQDFTDGVNRYTDRTHPVAYLWGHSDSGGNDRRFLEIRPTPTTAIQLRIYGIAYAQNIDNDNDVLEAPVEMARALEWDVCADMALFAGNGRESEFRSRARDLEKSFLDPSQDERKRLECMVPFDQVGGYRAFAHAE